tara:strand:+ start:3915 stop:5729 length:1815 start_codon:yes stop_codon:yes gene_type:complete
MALILDGTTGFNLPLGAEIGVGTNAPGGNGLHVDHTAGATLRLTRLGTSTSHYVQLETDGAHGTLSSTGDLFLNADGADIKLKDGSTEFGVFYNISSNFGIASQVQDKDIIFQANDGGSTITTMTIKGDGGNVGIGQTNPTYKFEVSGTGDTVQYIANANPSGTQGRTLVIRDNYASASQDSKISFAATSSPGNDVYLGKRTTSNAGFFHLTNSGGTEHMTVNMANGNVGIGATTPQCGLNIFGESTSNWADSDAMYNKDHPAFLKITNGQETVGVESGIVMRSKTSGAGVWSMYAKQTANYLADLHFRGRNAGNTSAVRLTLKSDGKIGIGTQTPYNNLHVFQTANSGNNYNQGTLQVGGTSGTLGFAMNYSALGSGRANIVAQNPSGGTNNRISLGFGAVQSYGEPADRVLTIDQGHFVHHTPSTAVRFMPMISPQSVTRHGAYPTHPGGDSVGTNQTNATQIGFAHVYQRNWSGGRYIHMKTNIPCSGSNYGMIMVYAKGYRYSPGGSIDSSWGFHNWGGAIYSLDQRNYATTFAVNCYATSDNYCVLVGDNQSSGSSTYTGFRLDFMYSNTNYSAHTETANGESHYLIATSLSSSTSGVY